MSSSTAEASWSAFSRFDCKTDLHTTKTHNPSLAPFLTQSVFIMALPICYHAIIWKWKLVFTVYNASFSALAAEDAPGQFKIMICLISHSSLFFLYLHIIMWLCHLVLHLVVSFLFFFMIFGSFHVFRYYRYSGHTGIILWACFSSFMLLLLVYVLLVVLKVFTVLSDLQTIDIHVKMYGRCLYWASYGTVFRSDDTASGGN